MILKRFFDEKLAHASYLIGCPASGEACVIDPNRDIDQYTAAAKSEGLRITAVTESHIHADFLSGARELAKVCGATLYLSDEGDADWKYAYADEPNVQLVRDGDSFRVGGVRLDVIKTTGHTPEHIAFMMTDEKVSPEPAAAFTGDFVFVGDVGRPDLLENAAGVKGTMEPGARDLYASLRKFAGYPDSLLIWPGHGAGSACGKSLGGVPVSTLGYEKISNWAFQAPSERAFVDEVLSGQPEPPRYFAQMKRMNKQGPPALGGFKTPAQLADGSRLAMPHREYLIDVRASEISCESHVPGSLHVPLTKGFTTWAGWFVPYDQDIWLIAESEADARQAARDLAMIGLDRVTGWYAPSALDQYQRAGGQLENFAQSTAKDLAPGEFLLDVRGKSEWDDGHIEGDHHIPLGLLPNRAGELPKDVRIAVHCQGGVRSPIAMSVLRMLGFTNTVDVTDGYMGLAEAKYGETVTA